MGGEQAVKASFVGHAFSMGKLCKRLGEFVAGDYAAVIASLVSEQLYPSLRPTWDISLEAAKSERGAPKELVEKVRREVKRLKEQEARER